MPEQWINTVAQRQDPAQQRKRGYRRRSTGILRDDVAHAAFRGSINTSCNAHAVSNVCAQLERGVGVVPKGPSCARQDRDDACSGARCYSVGYARAQ